MKKIAFVTSDLRSGGSERSASELTLSFGDMYKMYYMVFDSSEQSYKINAELVDINVPPAPSKIGKVINTFRRAHGIARCVKKNNIDLVMAFTPIANRAVRFSGLKCRKVAACRGYEHLALHPGEYHACIAAGCELLFNSVEAMEYYIGLYLDDKEKCFAISNLIDCERIEKMSAEPIPEEHRRFFDTHKTVCTVASFSHFKGHWDLFKSFTELKKSVPDAGLVLVGHMGELRESLEKMVRESPYADDVIFTDYTSNPFRYVKRADVYALPSITEGFPNALAEAMSCGKPCVATACKTGTRELLFDSDLYRDITEPTVADNGIICPTFDGKPNFDLTDISEVHRKYARAIETLLTDTALAQKLSANAKKRAQQLDKSRIFGQYRNFFEK